MLPHNVGHKLVLTIPFFGCFKWLRVSFRNFVSLVFDARSWKAGRMLMTALPVQSKLKCHTRCQKSRLLDARTDAGFVPDVGHT